jgi:ech hydrogenase subunit B
MGVVGLFIINSTWWSIIAAVAVCLLVYFLEVLIDMVFPRVKWELMLKATWLFTLVAGVLNLIVLSAIK